MRVWAKEAGWQPVSVGTGLAIGTGPGGRLAVGAGAAGRPLGRLVPFAESGITRVALVTAPGASLALNGHPSLSVAVLEDRDEISLAGVRLLFARYAPPEPALLPASATGARCGRCKAQLAPAVRCIRCPACHAFFHHEPPLDCFEYDPRCGSCGRPRAEIVWHPEEDDDDGEP